MSAMKLVGIGERHIGPGHRCFVIAEGGVNHNGDSTLAHKLIDMAAECGADAIKFQTFNPAALVSANSAAAPYQRKGGVTTQIEMLADLVLPASAWRELACHAAERGIVFCSTAFDSGSLKVLLDAGVGFLKVPSGELDNLQFISEVAACGLPVIISTGLGTLDEVSAAVAAAAEAPSLALLHCVTAYPAPAESSNLRVIPAMADAFKVPVGWSDHTVGYVTALGAVALGATILEKHITLDRNLPGPDHAASADPEAFASYIAAVRSLEAALGNGLKEPAAAELINKQFARRSYHVVRDLRPGDIVCKDDVRLLRPAVGLPPAAIVVGRVVARTVSAGMPLVEADLQ